MLKFDWDKNKNLSNIKKHNVDFKEAETVFLDEEALIIYDPDHSESEDRYVLIGYSVKANMLVVCHCYRENEETIRIISARKATKTEREIYGGRLNEERIRLH